MKQEWTCAVGLLSLQAERRVAARGLVRGGNGYTSWRRWWGLTSMPGVALIAPGSQGSARLVLGVVLVSLAAASSGSGGWRVDGTAPRQALRTWRVVHDSPLDAGRVFGYTAGEDAMAPAMTLSMRARARGETSDAIVVRCGPSVGICRVDDEGLAVQRHLTPQEIAAVRKMKPNELRALGTGNGGHGLRLALRGGVDDAGEKPVQEAATAVVEQEDMQVSKRPRADIPVDDMPAEAAPGDDAAASVGPTELDVGNETALELAFNTATDCDALEAMYTRVLESDSRHVSTLQHYGNLLMRIRGNYSGAQRMYERVLEAAPDHVPALCNYGNLLHNHLGDLDRAEELYVKALALQPNHTTTLSNYGLYLQNVKGDLARAEELYQKALDTDPAHATTLYNFARLLQEEKRDIVGAEEMFRRALASDPDHSHVLCSYGLLRLVNHHDTDGAEALYRRALESDPTHVATLYNYGSLLEGVRQNYTGAEHMYKRVLALDPQHPTTLSNYGGLLHTVLREYDRAEEMYKRALDRDPNSTATLCNYGLLQQTVRSRYQAAEGLYLRSLSVDRGHVATLCNYAYLSATMQNYSKAEELLQQALASEPAHEFAQHFLGWVRNKTRAVSPHSPAKPPGSPAAKGEASAPPVSVGAGAGGVDAGRNVEKMGLAGGSVGGGGSAASGTSAAGGGGLAAAPVNS